ncbi:glycosyltransferase family 2 protein [Halomonas organivorans]|uniref:Glycosyltransferase involved in cell wall biosynthesis n=1 Tax=Halomonas organivorans TaxID=257772 RepID=A0A7W5BZL1_9GAMM|nr:glycosyltransferase family 2 protein [Halomonas organivorans]MBB3142005.1 glycosyltransferase involved in cell wall biosynthesis [Halomonas organivorans]
MISVIVTTYNIEKYVEQCLESVIGQTFKELEIIVVDDGSSDGTREIINRIAGLDDRVVPVLLPENTLGGVAVAANIGLSKANGEYIGFVDGDDWCEPFMFEKLVFSATELGSDIVIGNFKNYDELSASYYDASDKRHWINGLPKNQLLSGEEATKSLLKFNPVPWRKLYKRSFLEENHIRFPEGDYFYEDNPFHWFCVTKAKTFSLVPEYLCYHRMNRVGQTMSSGDRRLLAMYEHHKTIHDWLVNNSLLETYKKELVLWVVNNSCWIHDAIKDEYKEDVISCLQRELSNYEPEFVKTTLAPGNMGNKGRRLAYRALGIEERDGSGQVNHSEKSLNKLGLVGDAVEYYKEYGALETAKKVKSYLHARAPAKVRRVVGRLRSSRDGSDDLEKVLKEVRDHVEFQKLMSALAEEENEKLREEIKAIRAELVEIKNKLG